LCGLLTGCAGHISVHRHGFSAQVLFWRSISAVEDLTSQSELRRQLNGGGPMSVGLASDAIVQLEAWRISGDVIRPTPGGCGSRNTGHSLGGGD